MKILRVDGGPFRERPYYKDEEIEVMAEDELHKVQLLPGTPQPIRIDRFIEKRFNIYPQYEALPPGVLGFTRFGTKGAQEVVVSRVLSEEGGRVSERRLNTTLAHEAGHMLLHGHLFALELRGGQSALIRDGIDSRDQKILCRTGVVGPEPASASYDGRWWEFQANQAIGPLLLPRSLVREALAPVLVTRGHMGLTTLDEESREEGVERLVAAFDVNPAVARLRTDKLYPPVEGGQLTL